MERGMMHVAHAALLGALLYVLMVFVLGQSANVAETRSVFIAGVALVYMLLFGHNMPGSVNKHLML